MTNWGSNTKDDFTFKLEDIDIVLDKGMKAVVSDPYDSTFTKEISSASEDFSIGKLESHQSRALKFELEFEAEVEEEEL